jgi:predicted TIM-barrel fold metal-dependent hydrolase
MHIFGPSSTFPYTPNRSFTPPDALIPDYLKMARTLGLERAVVVQASVYGSDNACTISAVKEIGLHRARGIVMVGEDVSTDTLRGLDECGIKGTRFITTVKGGPSIDNLPGVARKIADLGWHIEMYVPRRLWRDLIAVVADLPVPVVFDHMGGLSADIGENDPELKGILGLLETGKCWVKLCGYRASVTGHPYSDVAPLARRFVTRALERCIWGTDWPHTTIEGYMPDDGDLMDLILDWAPDAGARQKILVDNPATLYHF